LVVGQDTESNPAVTPGSDMDWTVHALPFHRSASGSFTSALVPQNPTAVQLVADGQETPSASPVFEPAGRGIDSRVQTLPFQNAVRGSNE
jgi:hypothetical protein